VSAQGDDFFAETVRRQLGEFDLTEAQFNEIIETLITCARQLQAQGVPVRLHTFSPGQYLIDGHQHEEFIFSLLIPVVGPPDVFRQAARSFNLRGGS
jgi:hypothetical protein